MVWGGIKLLGWLGGLNVAPTIPFAHILVLTLTLTTPASFIQIAPSLPKILFGVVPGGVWVVGVGLTYPQPFYKLI